MNFLRRELFEAHGREVERRVRRLVSVGRGHADHCDGCDLERMRLASRNPEVGTKYVGCIDDSARAWIALLEVDGIDRELLVAVENLDEPFDLILRVAEQYRTSFDLIGLRRR